MTIGELEYQARRRDYLALSVLDRRLQQADQYKDVREQVLLELGFFPTNRSIWTRPARQIENLVLDLPVVPFLVSALAIQAVFWCFGVYLGVAELMPALNTSIFPLLAAIAAYQSWRRARINSTVDDALKRKDMTNALIMNNPDLILPYIESTLYSSIIGKNSFGNLAMDVKIDMYIYSEIDNLEFVFDKSHHSLMEELFIMRAIKIFVARNENKLFRVRARELLGKGRYNHEFQAAAEKIMLVAEWRHLDSES